MVNVGKYVTCMDAIGMVESEQSPTKQIQTWSGNGSSISQEIHRLKAVGLKGDMCSFPEI